MSVFSRTSLGPRVIRVEIQLSEMITGVYEALKGQRSCQDDKTNVFQTGDKKIITASVNGYHVSCSPNTLDISQGLSALLSLRGKSREIIQLASKQDAVKALRTLRDDIPSSNESHQNLVDSILEIIKSYTF